MDADSATAGSLEALAGMRIDRLDAPARDVLALSLRRPDEKEVLLVRLSGADRGLALMSTRPKGEPASGTITKLRHHVAGRRIAAIEARSSRVLDLQLAPVPGKRSNLLRLALAQGQGNALVLDERDRVLCALHPVAAHHQPTPEEASASVPWPMDLPALRRAGEAQAATPPARDKTRPALRQLLKRRKAQLERRLKAIQGDIDRGDGAATLRHHATLLLSELHRLPPGQKHVTVHDHATAPPSSITVSIAEDLSAREQVDAWFKRARKLERGVEIATQRKVETQALIERAGQLLAHLDAPGDGEPATEARATAPGIEAALGELGIDPRGANASDSRPKPAKRKPYRVFRGTGGARILVGRGAADNDALTLHHAAPHDLWVHARGTAGAHVIVPRTKGHVCPPELLVDAALLAAHFSRFRNDAQVEVSHTDKRRVRKPKGSPPGRVRVDEERVLLVKMDAERLRRLLASEIREPG